jgi:hypothetical protein
VLPSTDSETKYNSGAEFDCKGSSYTLSFLRQPAAAVKGQAFGTQPQLILTDGNGNTVRVDEYYTRNKAFTEAVILRNDNGDCFCDADKPCQHQAFGVNACYDTVSDHGRKFCPAGTKRCVKPAAAPILFSTSSPDASCNCGGESPCLGADSVCTPKTDYNVWATNKYTDKTPECTASANWNAEIGTNPKAWWVKEWSSIYTDMSDWCEDHCHTQKDLPYANCPASHCTCQKNLSPSSHSCAAGEGHDGSCFCKTDQNECGKVEASGYNAYKSGGRAHASGLYTAHFTYPDLAIDSEGAGYELRVCLKHTHGSQRKRVCVDSQPFAVLPDIPTFSCAATPLYKNSQPEQSHLFRDMDHWCAVNCDAGFCPSTHCVCEHANADQCGIFDSAGICCPSGNVDGCGICNGDGSTCKFETPIAVQAPAEVFDKNLDCSLQMPCKHDLAGYCLPKINVKGEECYADDENLEASTGWGVGTWDVDTTTSAAVAPTADTSGQEAEHHKLCYCPAGSSDSTTRAKWQAALREDWLTDYSLAVEKQKDILTEFGLGNSYGDYSLQQITQIANSDVVLYEGSDCSGDAYKAFTNAAGNGPAWPLCSKMYPGGAAVKGNVASVKVMPGVKASLHKFCSPKPLASGGCNLEVTNTAGAQTGEYTTAGDWKLVFHQTSGDKKGKNQWGSVSANEYACQAGKCSSYSILDQLESIRTQSSDGNFMFKQVWNSGPSGASDTYNVWKQSSNPATSGVNSPVSGYQPVDIRKSGSYTYQTVSYHTGSIHHRPCFLWWCWSYYTYYTYPVYTTQYIKLFGGLHQSASPHTFLDGVTNTNSNFAYQQMYDFSIGATAGVSGIPADIGQSAGDVKLYVWVDQVEVSGGSNNVFDNNLGSIKLFGSPDCKVTLFEDSGFTGGSQTYSVGTHTVSTSTSSFRIHRDLSNPRPSCATKDQILRVPFATRWQTFDCPSCDCGCRCDSCGDDGPHCTKQMDPARSYPAIHFNPMVTDAALAGLDNFNGKEAVCVQVPSSLLGQIQGVELVGTSSAELDFSIAETGKSCLGTACDSDMAKCNLDETCSPILKRVIDNCDGGVDDECIGAEYQASKSNALFSKVYNCVSNSKCLSHYDWAQEHSDFDEIARRRSRRLVEGEGPMVRGTAIVAGSGKIFSDTTPGLEGARQPNPEYELGITESTGSHSTITVNIETVNVGELLASTTVSVQSSSGEAVSVQVTTSTSAADTTDAVREVAAQMSLQGVTKKDFGAAKQLSFRKAVGKAATVAWSKVSIESVSNLGLRRKLASGITVSFKIETSSDEENFVVGRAMASSQFVTTLQAELAGSGVIDESSAQSFTFDKDSVVKRTIPANKKKTKDSDDTVEANTLNKTMVIVIVVLTLLVVGLCVAGSRKSSKVQAGDAPAMSERKDVARGASIDVACASKDPDAIREDPDAIRAAAPARLEM